LWDVVKVLARSFQNDGSFETDESNFCKSLTMEWGIVFTNGYFYSILCKAKAIFLK
jgi:hypothetical protein